jgi:hypothetical protein
MVYPYRYSASKIDAADLKKIDDIIHQKDYLSDVEYQMRKRGQKRLEDLE